VLIADDEAPARERLRRLLLEIGPPWRLVAEAADGTEALRLRRAGDRCRAAGHPHAAGRRARLRPSAAALATPPAVVFVTAYDEHALAASTPRRRLSPQADRRDRLEAALARARSLTRAQLTALDLARQEPEYLVATYRGGVARIAVTRSSSAGRPEVRRRAARRRRGAAEESLRSLEERFGERFVRIHRNALVARAAVVGLEKDATVAATCASAASRTGSR